MMCIYKIKSAVISTVMRSISGSSFSPPASLHAQLVRKLLGLLNHSFIKLQFPMIIKVENVFCILSRILICKLKLKLSFTILIYRLYLNFSFFSWRLKSSTNYVIFQAMCLVEKKGKMKIEI